MSFLDYTDLGDFDIFDCINSQDYTMSDVVDILQEVNDEFIYSKIYEYLVETFFDEPDDKPADFYNACLDLLCDLESYVDPAAIESICVDVERIIAENSDVSEGVTAFMQKANINRKKRKFFALSKADLIKTKSERKLQNILNRSDRKKYYAANKRKIAKYAQSRNDLIKKGQHHVKMRRKV